MLLKQLFILPFIKRMIGWRAETGGDEERSDKRQGKKWVLARIGNIDSLNWRGLRLFDGGNDALVSLIFLNRS
jgi:hypothetical protein